ncbi:TPA: anhydro-N-acetylmuramic acid kinase [Candidatus Gastranaerophilales bacterium HUM_6]|nr:anhydro-N-acetylmuramic acid kinase [Fusobacterium sp. CAG:815]DAA90406.1 MAG TPA: anhydro-N-acetylmuramic acid kinase [Candidatus Gastranaerophilales bacterium HUM_6]DAA94807.1 MAG TPA: anhydro-N-acetylmuramic acid kinase [Candidatus Gastranaerophilales bacterium HUM_7]DAB03869.1 MAG TPA: anhydro-N-acetylmuramic acid kinase [Candidatus Gastranaerophilales bacterium HUM_12]DAB09365.1 MAG TPA: anhydro-N-acetylmuramic acid kinase [Candidatus Gastranaerophilales bacterium HUM_14]
MEELEVKKVIALMSGTSCDSIDAGLCEVYPDMTVKLIQGINYKYPEHIRAKIFQLFRGEASVKDICQMNFAIGKCFAEACKVLISEFGKPDFISSHGQTIYHYPFDKKIDGINLKSTLQIGESSVIAQETNCLTISNFREADMAQGGQGAPLVCFADEKWFKNKGKNFAIQNIGGISNVTVVSKDFDTFGFDTGLGNIMIDYCMNKYFSLPYDKDGEIAKEGTISDSWLACLLQDEYYFMNPPKSTGREYFSPKYIENTLKFAPQNPKDIIATVTALTAKTIADSYERFIYPNVGIHEAVICGGGAYNKTLMKYLRTYLPSYIDLKTCEDYGISNNFKEVMAFALLGYCTYYGIPNNLPCCTGAKKRVVMGKLTY